MFKNYFKIAIRNMMRYKGYSAINILGLSFGLSISLIIAFYVIDDLTFDRFHDKPENIYRLITVENSGDQGFQTYSITAGPLVAAIQDNIPEVVAATRVFFFGQVPIGRGDREFDPNDPNSGIRTRGMVADPELFRIFNFKLLRGDADKVLQGPGDILLTPETAKTLFGDEDPMGKPLTIPGLQETFVAGIVEAPPANSHIQFGVIGKLRPEQNPVWWDTWDNLMLSGYLRLADGADPKVVEKKIIELARKNNFADIYLPRIQPLLDVHLGSSQHQYDGANLGKNSKSVVYALTIIGIMVLIIAAINFINLSSARSALRAREVGLRKVVGSNRQQLISQFLGESIILTLIAMFIAAVIVQSAIPFLDTFLGKHLEINFFKDPFLIIFLLTGAICIGLLAGIYPALVLSSFKPISVLRGKFKSTGAGIFLRRVLVVFQFAITTALILGVLIVIIQINYLKNLDMGYDRSNIVVIPSFFGQGDDLLKNELLKIPAITGVGRISGLPGASPIRIEAIPEGMDRKDSRMFQQYVIDDNLVDLLKLDVLEGRNFSIDFASDTLENILINETAAKIAGWDNPINKRLDLIDVNANLISKRVIGLVKDFHYTNPRNSVEPMFFMYNPQQSPLLYARIQGDVTEVLKQVEAKYKEIFPGRPFNSFFLENFINQQFNQDRAFAGNIGFFSAIAILIACLGLLGLVSFAVSQRRQEIAVRKVLGSGETRIVSLLAMDFLKWVAIANILAWPLGYFGMSAWLSEFVFRVPFAIWPYLTAALGTLIIALLTISFQSIRAARANPTESLRVE